MKAPCLWEHLIHVCQAWINPSWVSLKKPSGDPRRELFLLPALRELNSLRVGGAWC